MDAVGHPAQSKRVVIIPGEFPAEVRGAALRGERPRSDVVEVERHFPIPLIEMKEVQHESGLRGMIAKVKATHRSLLRLKDADAAFITGEEFAIPLALMARLFGKNKPRLVVRLENLQQGRTHLRSVLFEVFLRQALKRIDLVLCRNSANHQLLLGVYGVPPNNTRLVFDCVDTKFFDPDLDAAHIEGFSLPKQPYIVSAGLERRDYPTLIEAVRTLGIHVVIGAASPWSMYRLEGESQRNLPPNVTIGAFDARQMRELYRAAAFVVIPLQPTLRTCGDSTLTEAWAMGKGVVITRTAGLLDFLRDGVNALTVGPGDVAAMRSAIRTMIENPTLCEKLGIAGRAAVLRDHLFEDYVNAIAASLAEVADR